MNKIIVGLCVMASSHASWAQSLGGIARATDDQIMLAKVVACLFVTIFVSLFAAVWKLRSVKSVRRPLRLICLWVGVLVSLFMAINKGFSFDQLSLYQPACLALALVLIFMINIVLRMDLAT